MDKEQEREISRLQNEIAAIRERLDRSYDALVTLMGEGGVEFASDAETQAGTIDNKAVTPESLHADGPATPAASRLVRLSSGGDMVLPGEVGIRTASESLSAGLTVFPSSAHGILIKRVTGKASIKANTSSFILDSSGGWCFLNYYVTDPIILAYGGGDVGIGTFISPGARLDIDAGAMRYAEMTAPSATTANSVVVFARDDGAGKTELCARFNSGAIQVIAAQP